MIEGKNLKSLKKAEIDFRKGMIAIFGLIFLGVVSYWIYETYEVYQTDVTLDEIVDLTHNIAKRNTAFQASILAFLVVAFFHFSQKLS
jgi:hypothetical protein